MKTVLITGASHGIGREIAKVFAYAGYFVGINYNNSESEAKQLLNEIIVKNGNGMLLKADVSDVNQVNNMVESFIEKAKHIDVLINNAGISQKGLFVDENDDITQKVLNVNLLGTIYTSKQALKCMLSNNGGKIINISSIWGNCGASMEATYSASKAGVIGLTKSLAKEYGFNNIKVNCICPGVIDTKMNSNLTKEERQELESEIMTNRFGEPKEVADLALFLAEKGEYITGQVITIDGGFTL